jgi:hypothetical protein
VARVGIDNAVSLHSVWFCCWDRSSITKKSYLSCLARASSIGKATLAPTCSTNLISGQTRSSLSYSYSLKCGFDMLLSHLILKLL